MLGRLSNLIACCQRITTGQDIGYPSSGKKCPKSACCRRKHACALNEQSKPCRPISGRSSSCATSRDGHLMKSAAPSAFPRGISGCSSTAPGRRYGVRLRSTFGKSRLNVTMKDELIPTICNESTSCKSIRRHTSTANGKDRWMVPCVSADASSSIKLLPVARVPRSTWTVMLLVAVQDENTYHETLKERA